VPGALIRIALATAASAAIAVSWGWSIGAGVVFGLSLAVASTVVMIRAFETRGILGTINGHIAVGWLIVEDLAMVLVLVLLPPLAGVLEGGGASGVWTALAITLAKVAVFVALMLLVGRRVLPRLLLMVARSGSRELFTLCVVAVAIAVAYGSAALFDVSFALGAFFAGMMMGESHLSQRAAEQSLPLREAFSVLFFVSVGMLFDPVVLLEHPGKVLTVVAIVMLGKTVVTIAIVLAAGYPLATALTVGAALAQIGEFSFILASLGLVLGVLPPEGQSLILVAAVISIALNPLLLVAVNPAARWASRQRALYRFVARGDDALSALPMAVPREFLSGQVVLVGYGRVGQRIAAALEESGIAYVVVEQNREAVQQLRRRGKPAVAGDAAQPEVLVQAHVANAAMLIVAAPDTAGMHKMIETARALQPDIEIVTRTHSDEEAAALRDVCAVFMGEHELAQAMTKHILGRMRAA
jgi:CPA2 family monovalent cation:H+ antiporter-2